MLTLQKKTVSLFGFASAFAAVEVEVGDITVITSVLGLDHRLRRWLLSTTVSTVAVSALSAHVAVCVSRRGSC